MSRIVYASWFIFLLPALFLAGCRQQPAPQPLAEAATDKLTINIAASDLYRITLADLQNAGLALENLDEQPVRLSQAGESVPYTIVDNNLIFYGQAPVSRYTRHRPYRLELGEPGPQMAENSAAPLNTDIPLVQQSIFLEENNIYEAQALAAETADPWFWRKLSGGEKLDIPINLPLNSEGDSFIQFDFYGQTHSPDVDNDHDLDLLINGRPVETIRWDGNIVYRPTIQLPPNTLPAGENMITLSNEAPGAAFLDIMFLNNLTVTYSAQPTAVNNKLSFEVSEPGTVNLTGFTQPPLIVDVHNPAQPTLLSGTTEADVTAVPIEANRHIIAAAPESLLTPASLVPIRESSWRDADNQADLLIITTDTLAPALAPLIAAREAQGLTAVVVPVAEIYDAFGQGAVSPDSINQFIKYTHEQWQSPQPHYLLLVGEATTDYKGHAHALPANHVPSPLVPVQFSGETVSDSRLADIDNDFRPDMAVGRWPVDSAEAVRALVNRTLAYESGEAANNVLFTADGSEPQFADMAERLGQRSGLADGGLTTLTGATAAEVTAAWNAGTWLTTYIGHGSLELWGKDNLFNIEAVADLQEGTPPIVVQLTCLTGLFAQPDVESLSEVMLKHEHGPVLIIAATSLTLSSHQEPFANRLLSELQNPATLRMGDAFQKAKAALALETDNGLREISDTFVLLGDPSALIVRPAHNSG